MSLAGMPPEMFSIIMNGMNLADIQSLRLTSTELRHLATQDHFNSCFRKKKVYLTKAWVQHFLDWTRMSTLPALITDLTIVGVFLTDGSLDEMIESNVSKQSSNKGGAVKPDGDPFVHDHSPATFRRFRTEHEQFYKSDQAALMLGEALCNLKASSVRLRSYTIDLAWAIYDVMYFHSGDSPARGPEKLWSTAASTTHAAMNALAKSGLSVRLVGISYETGCSLEQDQFGLLAISHSLQSLIGRVECLVMRTSYPTAHSDEALYSDLEPTSAPITAETLMLYKTHFANKARRAKGFSADIKTLELAFCSDLYRARETHPRRAPTARLLRRLRVMKDPFAGLKKVSITEAILETVDLLCMVQGECLKTLILHSVFLVGAFGSWQMVVDRCTSETSKLQRLSLSGANESEVRSGYIKFINRDAPRDRANRLQPQNFLEREGAEIREPIQLVYED